MGWAEDRYKDAKDNTVDSVKNVVEDVAKVVVGGVEVIADDFLGIDDDGGIVGSIKKIGSNFEDMVREAVDGVDKAIQSPWVRIAVRFIPGYGQVIGATLDAYAKLDSGEELTATDVANLAASYGSQYAKDWNLDPNQIKAAKTAVKIAENPDNAAAILAMDWGAEAIEPLETEVLTVASDYVSPETLKTIQENGYIRDAAQAGFDIVAGKDPKDVLLNYATDEGMEAFGREAVVSVAGEQSYDFLRENLDVARAGADYIQGKDPSQIIADRFGEDIATALGADDQLTKAVAMGTIQTAAMMDQGIPEYLAISSGAETFHQYGGTEQVGEYLSSLETTGLASNLGETFKPISTVLAGVEDAARTSLTREQMEQARTFARQAKDVTVAMSRGAAEFEDVVRGTLPEGVEVADLSGGDIDSYMQQVKEGLATVDYSFLKPEGGYLTTGGASRFQTGYGKAEALAGLGESPIDGQMAEMGAEYKMPELASMPTLPATEEEQGQSFELGQVQAARQGGRIEKKTGGVAANYRVPSENYVKRNAHLIKKMPDVFYLNPGLAKTGEELDSIYEYNARIEDVVGKQKMQTGGMAGEAPQGQAVASPPAGFIGQAPEMVPDEQTVADDVPLDVQDGTFVINAAAVEYAGSEDIKKMLTDAIAQAKTQGIDIQFNDGKIPSEEVVSLLVSRGEVIVPPALAKVIGYDRLEKINNRGKKEVQKRVAESEKKSEQQPVAAKRGGFISKTKK